MATTKEFRAYALEKLDTLDLMIRPMMGEWLLYNDGKLFGGFYDNRLLIKKTDGNAKFALAEAIPYPGAKPMYMIEDLEDKNRLCEIICTTTATLPKKKI